LSISLLLTYYLYQFSITKFSNQLLTALGVSCLPLLRSLEASIRLIITLPIRNKAIKLARSKYLNYISVTKQDCYTKSELGILQTKLKRIEYIYTGIERDFFDCITHLPATVFYMYMLFANTTNKKAIFTFILLNFCLGCIGFMTQVSKRKEAFQAEEELNEKVWRLLTSLGRVTYNKLVSKELDFILEYEINQYVTAVVIRQWIKVALILLNIGGIFIFLQDNIYPQELVSHLMLFALNWLYTLTGFISVCSMANGLETIKLPKQVTNHAQVNIKLKLDVPSIFHGADFSLSQGEVVVVTGPNGSGKTLLCRILAGLEPQMAKINLKSILMDSSNLIFDIEKQQLESNLLWQEYLEEKYSYLLTKSTLSKGETSFLLIATVALYKPTLLLLDEILDPIGDPMLRDIMKFLNILNCTTVVTTHRGTIANYFSTKYTIIDQKIKSVDN